ncbi:MAG: alpha-hydroxy acid oxidase [Gemmatimonadota bacterium]
MSGGAPAGPVTGADWEALGRAAMRPDAEAYVAGGAADELTLRWNREAFDRCRLTVRVPDETPPLETAVHLLGTTWPTPIFLAPTAYHRAFHPDGERATARGAAAAGVPYCVSSGTTTPLDDVVTAAAGAPLWFQLYLAKDRGKSRELVAMVQDLGVRALCLTVDTPSTGARDRETRAGFALPADVATPYWAHVRDDGDASPNPVSWRDVEWLVQAARVPVCVKGVLDPRDAERAAAMGCGAVMVSNHGARNLDTVPSALEALDRVAQRLGGRIPLTLDGGVRRGTDVLKALALGATAVGIGRPAVWGLAAAGADGVEAVCRIVQREFEMALALSGVRRVSAVSRDVLWS